MKRLLYSSAVLLLLLGCSQDGDITVENESGPYLEIKMDGSSYLLDDGETVTKRIDVGRKFLFGPDDRAVAVSGEGECKLPFRETVTVEDGRNTVVTVYGDAGYIDICNETGHTMELYLSPCADASWGEPLELVPDGYCTTWMVEEGCWDILTMTIAGEFEDYNVPIPPCDIAVYDILPPALLKAKGSSLKAAPERSGDTGDANLRKKKHKTRTVK